MIIEGVFLVTPVPDGFSVILKGLSGKLQIFKHLNGDPPQLTLLPDHSAESTEKCCTGKCSKRISLGFLNLGM